MKFFINRESSGILNLMDSYATMENVFLETKIACKYHLASAFLKKLYSEGYINSIMPAIGIAEEIIKKDKASAETKELE